MDRKGLSILGAVLAVVAAMRTTAPSQAQPQPTTQAPAKPNASGQASANCPADPTGPAGPWKAVCKYFGQASSQENAWSCVPQNTPVTFLIASVPDPKRTNLSLYFDRTVESLMWAVGDSGYSFEQYWIPWGNRPEMPLQTLSDWNCRRAELEQHADQPGVLVFRSRDAGNKVLLVFLVSETPTGGVSKPSLDNALSDLRSIAYLAGVPVKEILFAGPTFSGSLAPLADQLKPILQRDPEVRFNIVSGTASSGEAIKAFQNAMGDGAPFAASVETDDRASSLFFDFAKDRWFSPREVALLSEDETAYGFLASRIELTQPEKKLLMRYPRQIARLRNAYQDANASSPAPDSSVVEGVRLTLKDASDTSPIQLEKDTVDDLSEQQSPASQQAALAQISSNLRRERVDYTGIFATDILDSLFLSRYLRLSVPDNRILTFDSDLLFVREGETAPFTGILSVTNYPLFGRNQHWTRAELAGGVPRRVQFSSRYAEGTYNACRFLLQKDVVSWDVDQNGEFLLEYSRPRSPHGKQPPLWLTTLGRDGYWPVALLDWRDPISPNLFKSPHSPDEGKDREELHPESPSRVWFLLFWLVIMFSLAHCVYLFLLMCLPPEDKAAPKPWLVRQAQWIYEKILPDEPPPEPPEPPLARRKATERLLFRLLRDSCRGLRTVLRVYPEPTHSPTGYEIPFLLLATMVIASVVFLLTFSLSVFWTSSPREPWATWHWWIARVTLAALTALAVALIVRSRKAMVDNRADPAHPVSSLKQYWPITAPGIAFATFFCVIIQFLTTDKRYETGYFFSYRSLSLGSGVSPAAPLLLLTFAYLFWTWIHLWREYLIWWRRASLALNYLEPSAAQHIERVDECLGNIFSPKVWRPALLFFVAWLCVLQPWHSLRSIEYWSFDCLYILELALLYWMMSVVWSQFIWCWNHFQKFLEWLERSPIHNAFSRLRKETSWVPLVSRPKEHQLFISTRAWETLRALRKFDPEGLSDTEKNQLAQLKTKLNKIGSQPDTLSAELERALAEGRSLDPVTYGHLQKCLERAASQVRQQLTSNEWESGNSDSVQRVIDSGPRKNLTASERLLVLKEELVAYRYLMYIRYVFRHLRNLLRFVIVAFIFSVISLHSYPFAELRWIGLVCWLVLVTLGTGIGIVFAKMDRDAILSRLTETKANELGKNFVFRMVAFGALPLLTLVTTQFPAVGRLLSSWLQPALQSLR